MCCATQACEEFPASSFPPQFSQEQHTDPCPETESSLVVRTREETGKKRTREEKEENEMVIVKRRCVNSVLTEAFENFSLEEISESGGNS